MYELQIGDICDGSTLTIKWLDVFVNIVKLSTLSLQTIFIRSSKIMNCINCMEPFELFNIPHKIQD